MHTKVVKFLGITRAERAHGSLFDGFKAQIFLHVRCMHQHAVNICAHLITQGFSDHTQG